MQPLVLLFRSFFWRRIRDHYLLVLVTPALHTFIHVRAPEFDK